MGPLVLTTQIGVISPLLNVVSSWPLARVTMGPSERCRINSDRRRINNDEAQAVGRGKNPKLYLQLTRIEIGVPWVSFGLHVSVLVGAFYGWLN